MNLFPNIRSKDLLKAKILGINQRLLLIAKNTFGKSEKNVIQLPIVNRLLCCYM